VDPSTRRELFRYDDPNFNHNGGPFHFGPDGFLYMGIGDGGAGNDTGVGHNPTIGNAQDLTRIMGKMIRIDPLNRTGARPYAIPAGNPFAGGAGGALPEIYAYGFRNPFRFSFAPNGDLLVADVGQRSIEELDRVVAGGNYGWRYKEGPYKFDPATGNISADTTGLPPGLIDPIVHYDRDEGISIIGGFVYRGTRIPELVGKYVFGDFSDGFNPANGRLFYADLATGEIREFLLGPSDSPLGLYVKGMGEDNAGEIYLLASPTSSPTGTSGQVFLIVPEPSALALAGAAGLLLLRRRRA
jgi:MYXO-CTERM domain-containing protein